MKGNGIFLADVNMKIVISEQDMKRAISAWTWEMHGIEIEVEDVNIYGNGEDEYEAEVELDDEVVAYDEVIP